MARRARRPVAGETEALSAKSLSTDAEASAFFEPRVRFSEDFGRRLELLSRRRGARGALREGHGAGRIDGAGEEFTGFRPYRPGEDLRGLDWDLLARLDMPFVRTTRREATEQWTLLVDGSASMGVGPPPKFQRAAELAIALAHLALSGRGAEVLLRTNRQTPTGDVSELQLRRPEQLARARQWLEEMPAAGNSPMKAMFEGQAPTGRIVVIGDLLEAEPAELMRLSGRGRELTVVCLLAPDEMVPPLGSVEFTDPESGERLPVDVDRDLQTAFVHRFEERLEAFASASAKHRAGFVCHDTRTPFEDLVAEVLEGRRGRGV